jgi:hypothetical protein
LTSRRPSANEPRSATPALTVTAQPAQPPATVQPLAQPQSQKFLNIGEHYKMR